MRIMMVIKGLEGEGGGAERVFTQVATKLRDRGHDIRIVTFDDPGAPTYYPVPEAIPRLGLGISPVSRPTTRHALPRGMLALRREVRRTRPEVVVAFMHSSYVPVALALAGTGVPVVASEHIDGTHYRDRPAERRAIELALRFCVTKTVPTEAIRHEQQGRARGMTVTVPNPIDLDSFVPQPVQSAEPLVLAVGRFAAQKDFPTLIGAFARVAPEFPDWRLRIAGDGDLRPALERAVGDSGVAERIELPGMVRDMVAEYRRAGIFVLPSLYESFGLVTAEALACGRPAIGFADCVGAAALIEDGTNGLLIDPGNDRVAALADGLRRMMSDTAWRQGLAAAAPASVGRFALDRIVDTWESVLAQAVSPEGRLEKRMAQ